MCNSSSSGIPVIGDYLSKPARLLPMAGSAVGTMLGLGPTMTNLIGTGIGATQGLTTNLWGDRGSSAATSGAIKGFGQGMVGRGVGMGVNNWMTPPSKTPGVSYNPTFNEGFMSGMGQAVPFKNQINKGLNQQFFTPLDSPGVKVMSPDVTGAAPWQPIDMTFDPNVGAYANNNISWKVPSVTLPSGAPGGEAGEGQGQKKGSWLPSAAAILGAQLIKQPEYDVPSAESIYTDLINSGRVPTYATPLGKAAQDATLNNINNPNAILDDYSEPYKQAIIADLDQREADEIAQVRTIHTQNGTGGGSDEMRDIMTVQEKYRNYRGQQLGAIEQNLYNQRVSVYLDSISNAYGMDQANLATLAGLTNTTVSEAATKYGLKAQQVADFRNALYQLAISSAPTSENKVVSLAAKLLGGS